MLHVTPSLSLAPPVLKSIWLLTSSFLSLISLYNGHPSLVLLLRYVIWTGPSQCEGLVIEEGLC